MLVNIPFLIPQRETARTCASSLVRPFCLFPRHPLTRKPKKMGLKSYGPRAGTRRVFARKFRKHGLSGTTKVLHQYKLGDFVHIKVNGKHHGLRWPDA